MQFFTHEDQETQRCGAEFARQLKTGDVVCLYGEPGAGKSVFVRGMAKALGVDAYITSPTFTIVNEYGEGAIPLYHFDVYRLTCGEDALALGLEEYFDKDGICAIEWADIIEDIVPPHAYRVTLERDLSVDDAYRCITITGGGQAG